MSKNKRINTELRSSNNSYKKHFMLNKDKNKANNYMWINNQPCNNNFSSEANVK